MVLKKLSQTKKPNPKSKNAYHIGGIKVEFPYQPYGTQLAFMGRVISTLDRAQRDGHCHALLESPTGTGKSLSLLCSTLAWQQNCKLKNQLANFAPSKPNPEAVTDPLNHGGGFIPETQSTGNLPSGNQGPDQSAPDNKSSSKKKAAPTIFYASRTHSQISQAIGEYRKTSYRVPMAVLASRKNYCINENISGKENIDEQCKLSLRDESFGCTYFKNVHKLKSHPSLLKGGCHEVHDIEDLVKIGQVVKGCPYYAARSMADHAQLVFCPYSYIVNPVIRGAMELDIKEAIIILDEAHNIEDIARDAGSFDVEEDVLHKVQVELGQLCSVDTIVYQPLYEMTQDLLAWIGRRKDALEKCEFQHHFSSWTGDKALQELQEAGITRQCFPILLECATKAIKAATDPESEVAHLSGMSVLILEGLFSSLTFFFSRNGCHSDYQFVLQRHVIRHKKVMLSQKAVGDWTYTLSLWCLNPAVVFRDIAELSLSIILTSGTLSPMNTFTSELGVQFGTCFEAPHVINIESQVRAAVVSTGVDNYTLNASYKTADAYAFQDALGKSLEEIFKIVPAGSLVFFPSYKLMDKLCSRWLETGQWSRLHAIKVPFIEPRAGSQEDFDSVLKGYYNSIRKGNKPVARKKKLKRVEIGQIEDTDSSGKCKKDGAAFLAVFRGKVSEGIDFSDDNARVVIVVGIPFPNINDIKVNLKKKYNDTYKQSKNLLSGSEWYCQQAFRALNQAIGRCIRHRFDYGAIVMLDERYREERNRVHISKWLRNSLQQYDKFDMLLESLKSFFREAKENVGKIKLQLMPKSDLRDSLNDRSNILTDGCMRNTQEKVENFGCCGQEAVTLTNWGAAPPNLKLQGNVEEHVSIQIEEDADSCKEIIDLECHSFKDLRCSEISSLEEPEISVVSETPGVNGKLTAANEESFLKNGNCISSRVQDSIEQSDLLSLHPTSLTKLRETPFESQYSTMVSPEKVFTINTCRSTAGESSLNWSATSHTQKRRKFTGSPLTTTISNQSDAFDVQTHGSFNHTKEFSFESYNAESKSIMAGSPQCASPCLTSNIVMDKRLKISCSLCKTPLGLPANNLYVVCSLSSLTKVHLAFLARERLEHPVESTSAGVPVLLTDVSSVDQCLFNSTPYEAPPGQGFWSEEDGCVFKSVFCPFCSTSNCLGVKVMATDASNISLLNKVLLFVSCLQIQNHEILKDRGQNDKVSVPCHSPVISKMAALNSIDKFSYTPPQQSGGWRSTKSKLQLPKRKMHHAG